MSPLDAPSSAPAVRVTAIRVSAEPVKKNNGLFSGELHVDHQEYTLISDEDGTLHQQFWNPLKLSSKSQITLCYMTSRSQGRKIQRLDSRTLFTTSSDQTQELSVTQGDIQVVFNCQSDPIEPPPFVRITAVTVSPERRSTRLASGELRVGPRRHQLIRSQDGTLRQEFPNLIELSPEVQVTLSYVMESSLSRSKTRPIDTQCLFANSVGTRTQDLSVALGSIRVTFSCQATEATTPTPQPPEPEPPLPTAQTTLEDCVRFRILVIGKSGVGKSSLINTTFGINKTSASDLFRGDAYIEEGFESTVNKHLTLHDSLGFEPGDRGGYETVENFIRSRQTGPLKDQLHAVWFCVQAPRTGDRLLEVAAEKFFKAKVKTMGTIPLIVVYTKFDCLVDDVTMQLAMSSHGQPEESIAKQARSKAESGVQHQHNEINQFAGDSLPHAAVSIRENYKYTLENLIKLTYHQVAIRHMPNAQAFLMATPGVFPHVQAHLLTQRILDVVRKRYWKALTSNTIWESLSVIHADILAVWNFNDPNCHLTNHQFKELVVEMAREIETRPVPDPGTRISKLLPSGGSSLAGAAPNLLAIIANPAAPIIIPVVVVAVAAVSVWRYTHTLYQNKRNAPPIFMAFIVDMTHIMKTLFILTGRNHNKLTRRAIKIAYKIYYDSGLMNECHTDIQGYTGGVGRDGALEMIESLLKLERNGDPNVRKYYADLEKVDVWKLNLDQEEEWE